MRLRVASLVLLVVLGTACGGGGGGSHKGIPTTRTTAAPTPITMRTDACQAVDTAYGAYRDSHDEAALRNRVVDIANRLVAGSRTVNDTDLQKQFDTIKFTQPTTVEAFLRWCVSQGIGAPSLPTTTLPPPPTNPPTMSLDEFNQIQTGMSYEDVVAIVGGPGQQLSHYEVAGYVGDVYMWDGVGGIGANANVQLQNGKVIGKSQFGLR